MHKQEQSGFGANQMSEKLERANLSVSQINLMRTNFFDIRRVLKLMRDAADNASWFTIRHAEVALMLFDQVPEHGLEQQLVHKICGLNQSTTHRIIQSFEELGWIEVEHDAADKRLRRIKITKTPVVAGTLSGEQVIGLLLDAGTKRDNGALLQKNFETRLLQTHNVVPLVAQDITMKAEVGQVTVTTTDAKLIERKRLENWEHDKAIADWNAGKIERRMDRKKDGRWSIYREGIAEPIGVQKDMPIAELNDIIDEIGDAIIKAISLDSARIEEPLEGLLTAWSEKLNRDEYQLMRQKLMVRMADKVEELQEQAKKQQLESARTKQNADRALAQSEANPYMHQEQMWHAMASKYLKEWAETEKAMDKTLTSKDKLSMAMATIFKLNDQLKEVTGYGSGGFGEGAYGGTEVEEEDDA